ncbi:MAG: hypothetical protein ACI910_001843 [Oleispira sp.]|jgi:hypothetical protein
MLLLARHSFASKLVRLTTCLTFLYCLPSLSWAAEVDSDLEAPSSEALAAENPEAEASDSKAAGSAETKALFHYTPDIPKKRAQSLIQYMTLMQRQEEVVQLSSLSNANADESDTRLAEDYYGLFLADATGSPQGGVLILHDSQQHGHWPDIVAPLREYLPEHGWTTLTIELPDTPARLRIARDDIIAKSRSKNSSTDTNEDDNANGLEPITTDQDSEPLLTEEAIDNAGPDLQGQPVELKEDIADTPTDESLEPALPKLTKLPDLADASLAEATVPKETDVDPIEHYRKQNQQRIFAAMEYLRSKGQLNLVIIGYGIGAAWAIDYLAQKEDANVDKKGLTLVTIDALHSNYSTMVMNQQLGKIKLPFLDLIQPNKAYALKQGKARRAIMNRNQNEKYQQIITSNMPSYDEHESPTNRRIRGWLKTNAGGIMVKMNN